MNLIDSSILTLLFWFGCLPAASLFCEWELTGAIMAACLMGGIGMAGQVWLWRYMLRILGA